MPPSLASIDAVLRAQGLGVEKKVKGACFEGVDAVKQSPGLTSLRSLRAVFAPHARTDDVALERTPVLETYLALVNGRDRAVWFDQDALLRPKPPPSVRRCRPSLHPEQRVWTMSTLSTAKKRVR